MKTARIFIAFLYCLIRLTLLPAIAQESTYSADSLMATFEKGSKISLKGTEIAFRDVVVESKNSKVTFKSSESNRVVCELLSSPRPDTQPVVGMSLTVTGKVRGRGLLGNVTLDGCSIVPSIESKVSPEPAPQEVASAPPEIGVEETLPLAASVSEDPQESPKKVTTTPGGRPVRAVPEPVRQAPVVSAAQDYQREKTANATSDSQPHVPYGFYALLVLSGAVGSSILSKVLGLALRFSKSSPPENTPEVRQAALQALLLKASKKK